MVRFEGVLKKEPTLAIMKVNPKKVVKNLYHFFHTISYPPSPTFYTTNCSVTVPYNLELAWCG